MTKALNLLDKVMYWNLLVLVFFIPYSSAMTQGCLIVLLLAWLIKRTLILKSTPNQKIAVSYFFPSHGLQWPLLVLTALIIFTIPFSFDSALSLKKFFSRFVQQIFLMYCVAEIINTPKRLYQVLAMLLLTLIVVNSDVIFQYIYGHSFIFSDKLLFQRVSGPMRHPNDLGTLLVTVLPVILSLLITKRFWMPFVFRQKFLLILTILGWLLFTCSVMSLGLSVSRGAWLAFTISMLGYGIYLKNYRLTGGVLFILMIFFWVFIMNCINVRSDISPKARMNALNKIEANVSSKEFLIKDEELLEAPFENKLENINTIKRLDSEKVFLNFSSRGFYWQTAINIWKERPLIGCGYNAYIQKLKSMKVGHEEYPHNSLLHIAAELGLIGLFAYLWFFISLLLAGLDILKSISFHKNLYILGVGLSFGILAWLIHSLLDTPWESLLLNILWWTLLGVLLSLKTVFQNFKLNQEGEV